jgi:hypothetical protein
MGMNLSSFIQPDRVARAGLWRALMLCFFLLPETVMAQTPTDAQIKKDLSGAKTVSVTLGKPGKVEWSSTYKKYLWTRSFTAKVKTETPDIFILVKGYAAYDVVGGKYTYWRSFTTSNSYEGIANPTAAEVFAVLKKVGWQSLMRGFYHNVIGEVESAKVADEPNWEWHTPNSVSVTLELVYDYVVSYTVVEKQRVNYRIRLYRDGVQQPWKNLLVTQMRKAATLDSKTYTQKQIEQMPHPTGYPFE